MAVWLPKFKLDCHKCSDAGKLERGCETDSPIPGMWKLNDWEFARCPRKLVARKSVDYLSAYFFFTKGYLPNPGGWLDQPAKLIDALILIEREIMKVKESEEK